MQDSGYRRDKQPSGVKGRARAQPKARARQHRHPGLSRAVSCILYRPGGYFTRPWI